MSKTVPDRPCLIQQYAQKPYRLIEADGFRIRLYAVVGDAVALCYCEDGKELTLLGYLANDLSRVRWWHFVFKPTIAEFELPCPLQWDDGLPVVGEHRLRILLRIKEAVESIGEKCAFTNPPAA